MSGGKSVKGCGRSPMLSLMFGFLGSNVPLLPVADFTPAGSKTTISCCGFPLSNMPGLSGKMTPSWPSAL